MKTKKSRRENLEDLVAVLAKHNAPSLLVLEIANILKDGDDEFKVQDFRNKVDALRPNDHEHGTGGKPYEKVCIPAVKEFVRFWIDDMQKEYNVMDFNTWRVMMEQLGIAIESLKEKDDAFVEEMKKSVEKYQKGKSDYVYMHRDMGSRDEETGYRHYPP
jgi:hypothetical protein